MNANRYNYSYTNRIGNALTEPFYQLYKADTKYLEALDVKHKGIAKVIFNSINMLLLNIVAIPLSLPLWFIGKAITQYTSPKINYSPSFHTKSPLNETLIKINLLDMVKDHTERVIKEVSSHEFWDTFHEVETIPDMRSSKVTDSMPFLKRQIILTKLKDSNHLVEAIQKRINNEMLDNYKDVRALKRTDLINKSSFHDYNGYLVTLVSRNHKFSLEEAINFVATNFYSDNNITYQGANCLLQGIGVLS